MPDGHSAFRLSGKAMTMMPEKIYAHIYEHCADGILVSDVQGLITQANPAALRLLGATIQDVLGQPLNQIVDLSVNQQEPAGNISQAAAAAEMNNQAPVVGTIFCRQGLSLSMPVGQIPLTNGTNATEGHLTIIYIVQANTVQQAQTEFVSTVSHELRTPLTSIKGFADTILRAGERLDTSQQRRYVGIIKDQADRLARLVEDLLAVSRLESRKMQLTIRAINLEAAVERVCQNLSDKAAKHKFIVNMPRGLAPVWADADRLEQILTNLIDNAIKYSPAGTAVTITGRSIVENQEMVEFSVRDQGGGIDKEHLPHIFNKFSRLDNPLTRQTEGTGLGLYITKSLVNALGGSIKVESEGGATTFTVRLPAASLEQQAAMGRG